MEYEPKIIFNRVQPVWHHTIMFGCYTKHQLDTAFPAFSPSLCLHHVRAPSPQDMQPSPKPT